MGLAKVWLINEDLETRGIVPQFFLGRIRKMLKLVGKEVKQNFIEVGVVMVGKVRIRQLNKIYRKHDKVTDILSFTYQDKPIAGELIICLQQALVQAKRRKHSLGRELDILSIHGLLHLAGHDHMKPSERKVMRALEKKILNTLK